MKKEEIHWADWHRIFIGDAPGIFLVEVLIRSVVIYFFLLLIFRLMGKRMSGQLTITEMAVMLTMGAIISMPMQSPERGILQAMVILFFALIFQRGLTLAGFKYSKIETLTQGKGSLLVKDGIVLLDALTEAKVSKQQLFTVLRDQKIFNLGKVERLYLEACGLFNTYQFKDQKPGLSVLPITDEKLKDFQEKDEKFIACTYCGHVEEKQPEVQYCPICNQNAWQVAVK
jgi:uncharacterized membrane protein YcaP (DUF421 family)